MKQDNFEARKGEVHDVCLQYIDGVATKEAVKVAFNAYCDVNGAHARGSRESIIGWREIVAGAVVIDCLHALDVEQANNLEAVLKEIAREWN